MKICKDCVYRDVYICDKHGEIPVQIISKEIKCPDFEKMSDGFEELKRWLENTPAGTIEHGYIESMINMTLLKPAPNFDEAVQWLYTLPDSKSVRSVRAGVFVFDTRSPF